MRFAICAALRFSSYAFLQIIFSENDTCSAKCICLDYVASGFKIIAMHILDCRWFGDYEILIASGKMFAAKIIWGQILPLQMRSCRPIKYDDFFL